MFETIKNVGTTVAVAAAITSSGWWLVKPHAENFVDETLRQRGYALQEQVDETNDRLTAQQRNISENNRLATETKDKIEVLEGKIEALIQELQGRQ